MNKGINSNYERNESYKNIGMSIQRMAINLALLLVWGVFGIVYVSWICIVGKTPFAEYAVLEEGMTYFQYVVIGNVVPYVLFVFSLIGIGALALIPISCVGKSTLYTYQIIISIIGAVAIVISLFSDTAEDYISAFSMNFYGDGVSGSIPLLPVAALVAPIFLSWLLTNKFKDSTLKSLIAFGCGIAVAFVTAAIAFAITSFSYLLAQNALWGAGLVWLFIGIGGLLAPPTTYVIIIVKKD